MECTAADEGTPTSPAPTQRSGESEPSHDVDASAEIAPSLGAVKDTTPRPELPGPAEGARTDLPRARFQLHAPIDTDGRDTDVDVPTAPGRTHEPNGVDGVSPYGLLPVSTQSQLDGRPNVVAAHEPSAFADLDRVERHRPDGSLTKLEGSPGDASDHMGDGATPDPAMADDSLVPLSEMPGLMPPRLEPPIPAIAFWRRSIILGGVVSALGGLTLWEHSMIPDRPASPVITLATPAPNATPLDAGMAEALRRVRTALIAHDIVTLTGMVDPDGLVVGPYSGGIPDSGYPIPETRSFLSNVMTDARLVTPGWRTDSRGRIFLLVDGWRTRPLSLSPNSTLELTPLVALVMQVRNGIWSIRWFLIDATGILTQQARNVTWQAVP